MHRSNSSSLAYRDEGAGPAVIFIHGWGVDGSLFEEQVTALSPDFRVVVPDLPGHGASADFGPDDRFSRLADEVAELILELELQPACLIGWSMGAMVSWDLLSRHREIQIDRLVTIDMVPYLKTGPEWPFGLRDENDRGFWSSHAALMRADWDAYCHLFVPRMFAPGSDDATKAQEGRVIPVALANKSEHMAAVWQSMGAQDFRKALQGISVPTLVVTGRLSQLYGVDAANWVAEHMSKARSVVFDRSGHSPHMEEPEAFNAMLQEFLSMQPTQHKTQGTGSGSDRADSIFGGSEYV
ncbi:MAG: alpha/beta hydrolase [Xanthomonadales bacterium]|nr:alpha/beta hydrolase [Xanthomonadales bacterium]